MPLLLSIFHSVSKIKPRTKLRLLFSLSFTYLFFVRRLKNMSEFSSTVLSDLYIFCSFVFSNPLYFSYFVFFSPYLFKLLLFLSPLFVTTSLLIVCPGLLHNSRVESETDGEDDEFLHFGFEEFEVYKIVFEGSVFEVGEEVLEANACSQAFREEPVDKCAIESEVATGNSETDPAEALWPEIDQKEKDENLSCKKEEIDEKEIMPLTLSIESDKVAAQPPTRSGSNAIQNEIRESKVSIEHDGDQEQYKTPRALESYPSFDPYLGSYGSMRKEKEWKRMLACKLFEERRNPEGGEAEAEGMDMLWETYEAEATKAQPKGTKDKTKSYEDDENDEEDDVGVQLCCLQALKFSAGKMNLGMGRPSLVKFSKALKGMGWLHHARKKPRDH